MPELRELSGAEIDRRIRDHRHAAAMAITAAADGVELHRANGYLASDDARWVSGAVIDVSGGWS